MDTSIVNQVRTEPDKYILKAEELLRDADQQLQQALKRYAKTSAQYCGLQCKQQQARAIYRAVLAIVVQRRVMSSDAVVLERGLSRGIWAIHKTIQ